ncbi:MAG: glycosyltransferase family 9 protein [Flavobacteriaceae bacterium]
MGDVAMTVPVIRALIDQHPDCEVTVLSKPFLKPLFENIPNVHFYAAEVKGKHKGMLGLYRLYKELSKKNITHVADLHNVLRSKVVRAFFKLSGKPIGFIDKGRAEKKALTSTVNKVFKQLKTSHQRYADVFSSLGFTINIYNPIPIKKKPLSKNIIKLTSEKEHTWVGLAPFAAFQGKVYPLHLMEVVLEKLSSKGLKIFLFGGGEHEIQILKTLEEKYDHTVSIAGKISFKEELDLIQSMDLMISMDSGNAHLAAMQGIKTITLWGVTHPFAGFAPYNQPPDYCMLPDLEKYPKIPCSVYGNKVIEGYETVMESIDPEEVATKVLSVLNS